jgi:outer membrane protein insertion porin family
MRFFRHVRAGVTAACFLVPLMGPVAAQAQQPQQQQQQPPTTPPAQPQQQPPTTPPAQPPVKPNNPFETVTPVTQGQQEQNAPKPEAPAAQLPLKPLEGQVVVNIEFRGARRVPQDTLRALIFTKKGDVFNEEILRRDFMILWNTGKFDDIRLETEQDPEGLVIRFVVTERRVIRSIHYSGNKSVSESEILDRFKERKVGLTVEQQYDPGKVQYAASVLKDYLAERGRQYATVEPQIEQIPPTSLALTFVVNEGPKVKVGELEFSGNNAFTSRWVRSQMKELKPYGIPHSVILENVFAKTFDTDKLEYDMSKIREAYNDKGYYRAQTLEPTIKIALRGGSGWRLPLIKPNNLGIFADVKIPIEEGRLYHLHAANFVGVKVFRQPEALLGFFRMRVGDVFSTDKLRKGLEDMRKYYGLLGYWDFAPEPQEEVIPDTDQIDLTITADEGKQFFVRRIEFSGNTTTRDKVIRREFQLDEGDIFNTQMLDVSILRLNQLGYFEMLKKEDSVNIQRNPGSDTVDITLKVRERGKNSIGLNGGVSGIAGSFVGFNYSTNNFLGLGETLSLSSQLGTRSRDASFGFTEPYFLDRPIQLGFSVYLRRFDFDQGREASILAGQNLIGLYNNLGSQNLLNYIQNSHGFNVSASYPLRKSFARLSVTYGYDISNIKTLTTAADNYFQYINFSGVSGPNALDGIRTSTITPSYQYNTVNHPINPTGGHSLFISTSFAGSVLGGNVNTVQPSVDAKYFHVVPWHKTHVLAFHLLATMTTGYGGKLIPPYSRGFIGGEQDVRGFEIWGITPVGFVPSSAQINVLNDNGTPRTQKIISGGAIVSSPVTTTIPVYQLVTPGGDTRIVGNFEYRIPIIGNTVILAPFTDAGLDKILLPNQLVLAPSRTDDLNQSFPQSGFDGRVKIAPGTQKIRVSTGLELQVMLPVVNAPFRVYFAYNPVTVREYLQPPIVADRASFPNNATFLNAINTYGQAYPFFEKRTLFKFTIGRTF